MTPPHVQSTECVDSDCRSAQLLVADHNQHYDHHHDHAGQDRHDDSVVAPRDDQSCGDPRSGGNGLEFIGGIDELVGAIPEPIT